MDGEYGQETAARARTRREIVRVAIPALVTEPAISMAGIAAAAEVSRSTLHRYFPDREALRAAIDAHVEAEYEQCAARAATSPGDGLTRFLRFVDDVLTQPETFSWWMAFETSVEPTSDDEPITALIITGQQDGTIDPTLPPIWVAEITWACLYVAHQRSRSGQERPATARELCGRTIEKLIAPQRS